MLTIRNNPYRTVGLLVGATAKEQDKQIKRLKQFIEADQLLQEDFSFPALGKLDRSIESINEASSKLYLDRDKMHAALFWFYMGNSLVDEPAFEALKKSNDKASIVIWSKQVTNSEVDGLNSSSYQNLSTLYLTLAFKGAYINANYLEEGIALKLKFLESDFYKDFTSLVTDETYSVSKIDLQLMFLNQIQYEIEEFGGINPKKFPEILNKQSFSAKEHFIDSLIQKPIHRLERIVEDSRTKRKANKSDSISIGESLYDQTFQLIPQLYTLIGHSNNKVITISDRVSDEILQCGIDYFTFYRDSDRDPGSASMELFRKAKTLAVGNIAKQRCQENTENLQEWIDQRTDSGRHASIIVDFERVKALIDENEQNGDTIANAKLFISAAKPFLVNIKNALGNKDEIYLGISSRIASDAEAKLIKEINNIHDSISNSLENSNKLTLFVLLKQKVDQALEVSVAISNMDLRQDIRDRLVLTRDALLNQKNKLARVPTSSIGNHSSKGNCYIATMAYGGYDHPQVMVLRQYRDQVLDKSILGKLLIKFYYFHSPVVVKLLRNNKPIKSIIRNILDQLIKFIK